jgi:hypothetical protein
LAHYITRLQTENLKQRKYNIYPGPNAEGRLQILAIFTSQPRKHPHAEFSRTESDQNASEVVKEHLQLCHQVQHKQTQLKHNECVPMMNDVTVHDKSGKSFRENISLHLLKTKPV